MQPQDLKLGSVSPSVQRWGILLVVLLTLAPRGFEAMSTAPWTAAASEASGGVTAEPDLLQVIGSQTVVWGSAPLVQLVHGLDRTLSGNGRLWLAVQIVASVWIALLLMHRASRWLDYPSGATASVFWALTALVVGTTVLPGPAVLLGLGQLLFVDALLAFARRRAPAQAWKLGLQLGLLSWLGGLGALWLIVSVAWLPFMSHRFRGWPAVRLGATLVLVWAVTLSPVVVRNLVVTGELQPPFPGSSSAIVAAADNGDLWPASMVEVAEIPDAAPSTQAGLGDALGALTSGDGLAWRSAARRALAFVGGWNPSMAPTAVPLLRWDLLVVLSWLGTVALIPSRRAYLPLYFGLGLPLLQGAFTGLGPTSLGAAAPFVVLFAGYGVQRWWRGKGWPATWIVAPIVLAAALLARSWVGAWV